MRFTDNRGFSLVEMLITTMIMSLVMVVVVSGSTVAQRLYRNTMAKADAQMILSQIERYLRDDLSFADECKIKLTRYDDDGNPTEGVVTQYHKNGFWYALDTGEDNFLYKTFSATGEEQDEELTSGDNETLYEPLSTHKRSRLEDISVLLPQITYILDDNCFHVSNLGVQLDGNTIAGSGGAETNPEESGGADAGADSGGTDAAEMPPYLIVRALNQMKWAAD